VLNDDGFGFGLRSEGDGWLMLLVHSDAFQG
jgi:hypothetical protein